jgi:hypothetical protein
MTEKAVATPKQKLLLFIMLASEGDLYSHNSAHCFPIQISLALMDARTLTVVEKETRLIKPYRFRCSKTKFHGIPDKVAFRNGKPFGQVLRSLEPMFQRADQYINYYAPRHMDLLKHECIRQQVHFPWLESKRCQDVQPMTPDGMRVSLTKMCQGYNIPFKAVRNAEDNLNLLIECFKRK